MCLRVWSSRRRGTDDSLIARLMMWRAVDVLAVSTVPRKGRRRISRSKKNRKDEMRREEANGKSAIMAECLPMLRHPFCASWAYEGASHQNVFRVVIWPMASATHRHCSSTRQLSIGARARETQGGEGDRGRVAGEIACGASTTTRSCVSAVMCCAVSSPAACLQISLQMDS